MNIKATFIRQSFLTMCMYVALHILVFFCDVVVWHVMHFVKIYGFAFFKKSASFYDRVCLLVDWKKWMKSKSWSTSKL